MSRYLIIIIAALVLGCKDKPGQDELFVQDVMKPVVSLDGTWQICIDPTDNFLEPSSGNEWKDIQVPGELMMQGFPVRHDKPFVYKKLINIPSDYKGKYIALRFEGVYSYARVWVDGNYIRDHSGGFTAWECDISDHVRPGSDALLLVEVTDQANQISYASGYAKHPIGGILRSVSLISLPSNHPREIIISTDLDNQYRNAILTVTGKISGKSSKASIKLNLVTPANQVVHLNDQEVAIKDSVFSIKNLIQNPLKWDAEHPNLYRLQITYMEEGKILLSKWYSVGFREIEISGNKFLVNGIQIRLKGACRHDIHPLMGRSATPEYDLKDVILAKEANMNFIRTSHYPPTDYFLQLCDKYGIYVEDETAVCFVGTHRLPAYAPGNTEDDAAYTSLYFSQLREMVYEHRNHPSVILWSIGNENQFGRNFKASYDWVKSTDPGRPVIFSYPGQVPDSIKAYDVVSIHYPEVNGTISQYGKNIKAFGYEEMPVLFDEWAHVPCYNRNTVRDDPNIRDFWGISLDSMWQKAYDSDGGLGGAIWGMIDETFMLPLDLPGYKDWWGSDDETVTYSGKTVGYGEWGIVDTWRRKKPEFWNTKKAYSPVRILSREIDFSKPGNVIEIPVYNRYDFTNLNEIFVRYTLNDTVLSIPGPDIPAHSRGVLAIPRSIIADGKPLMIEVVDKSGNQIDTYSMGELSGTEAGNMENQEVKSINLIEDNDYFYASDESKFRIKIDKRTGLISQVVLHGMELPFSGPFLNLKTRGEKTRYSVNDYGKGWKLRKLSVRMKGDNILLASAGDYESIKNVRFSTEIFSDGSISTTYNLHNVQVQNFEPVHELGIKFILGEKIDSLEWKRASYWNSYPEGYLSSPEGKIPLYPEKLKRYRMNPGKDWELDTKSFYYDGTEDEAKTSLTNRARATKENILWYALHLNENEHIIVKGSSTESCRLEKKGDAFNLYISNLLDYPDISWGNYQRNILTGSDFEGNVRIILNDGR